MPVSFISGIRRSMTGASASLLLITIISLNIVWGYPWMGMFAATSTMLFIGMIANQLFGPRLAVHLTLPNYAVAGESFPVTMHLHHRNRIPTFDNRIGFANPPLSMGLKSDHPVEPYDQQSFQWVPFIEADGRLQTHVQLKGNKRGVHWLPAVESRTRFPFHLFECNRRWDSNASIAIAPAPLDREKDLMCGQLMNQVSRWTQRWQSGDSFDFAGNREYEVGMPVRRWDFRSWARLGRPIVQEFQSPSTRMATIIVDASIDESIHRTKSSKEQEADFEQLLRWVATAIEHWSRLSISTHMYVSSEPVAAFLRDDFQGLSELSKLMVQLADATMIDSTESDHRIETVLETVDPASVILFTVRNQLGQNKHAANNKTNHRAAEKDDLIHHVNVVRYESNPELLGDTTPVLAASEVMS